MACSTASSRPRRLRNINQAAIVSEHLRVKIALLTTDNREHQRTYEETVPRFGPAIESVLQGLFRTPELEIHVVSCTQRPMYAPEKLSQNTWFHLLHVPKIGWLRTGYQGCVRAIRRKLRELQPDLVHGEGTERECALSAVFSGFPNVVTIHGNMREVAHTLRAPIGSYLWCAARLECFTLPKSGGVLCNSEYTENVMVSSNRRTWRVANALRLPFFETPLCFRDTAARPILLNIGGINPRKRQVELLDLAEKLRSDGHSFEVHFIGAVHHLDAYTRMFLERIKTAEKDGYARYLGAMAIDSLISKLDSASALVHVPTEEAFGLVVAEALARNLKFFGSRVGGVPDIAEGVEGAELYGPDDEEGLIKAIGDWLTEGCRRPTTAANEMRLRYHPDVIAAGHLEIYQDMLSLAPRG
ncbi:MAG: glycosyltransferase family 4 protein [Chthoniobacterales bacterium]|nr:glycosyltransferase family 4 protein [Chthoniobacterales bacterium]